MRISQLRRSTISLLGVVLAYGVYLLCVVPFVEPKEAESRRASSSSSGTSFAAADQYLRELASLFPEGSWELDQPKILRSEQATILLQEFEEVEGGRLRIRPCTIVFYGSQENQRDAGPTIMQAPQGAILAFDEPLDLAAVRFGKPVSGQLVGSIRIVRVGSQNAEDLELVTSNVVISSKQIWTREKVSFRFGDTYGSGHELLISRAQRNDNSSSDPRRLLDDLGTIELQRIDRLTFAVKQGELFDSFASAIPATPSEQTTDSELPGRVEVQCAGPMILDLNRMKATLEDKVTISRQQTGQPPDTLLASNLSMYFSRNEDASATAPAIPKTQLAITRLVAEGRPLVVDAKSQQAFLECRRLEYDFAQRNLKLFGANPFASRPAEKTTHQVHLRGPHYEIAAPSLELHNHEDRMQWQLHAEGSGRFQGTWDGKSSVHASWSQHLKLEPQQGQQVLSIAGDAKVHTPQAGTVAAERIELWLTQDVKHVGTKLDGTPIHKTTAKPIKLVTRSHGQEATEIAAQQFQGTLQDVQVFFHPNPHPANPSHDNISLTDERGFPARSTVTGPVAGPPTSNSSFTIHGGALSAWVDPESNEVYRIILQGASQIVEKTPAGQRPLQLSGDAIDVALVQGIPIATLRGAPATIGAPDLAASGQSIQYDGTRNTIHIPGAGTLTLQTSAEMLQKLGGTPAMPLATDRVADAARPKVLRPVEVSWQQGLHFDGQTVSLSQNVRVRGEDMSFATNDARIGLVHRIDLAHLNATSAPPEVAYISARGGVSAAVRARDDAHAPESFQQIATQDLHVDLVSGDLLAAGPGRMSMTSAKPLMPSLKPGETDTDSPTGLSHISLSFQNQVQGNVFRHEVHLHDKVRMWMGPVLDWNASVDPTQKGTLRKDDFWMSCQELFVLESPTVMATDQRKPVELLARGDAYVEGQLYAAKGHQIKYAEEKDMLTLEGDMQRPAELWMRKSPHERGTSQGRVRRIRYWPKSEKVALDGTIGLDVTAAPSANRK